MNERNLEFESNLVGWLAHSETGRSAFSSMFSSGVLEHPGADKYVEILLTHGPKSASARLRDYAYDGSIDQRDIETACRWAQKAPSVDDIYMLDTARQYFKSRCYAIYAEQAALASEVWDDTLLSAAGKELSERLSKLTIEESNGFTAMGLAKAFSSEKQTDLFQLPGYVSRMFRGRLVRGALVTFQAQPKVGKSAVLARCTVAAMRYGNRVLHVSINDQDQYETSARIISCECQRNGEPYEEGREYHPVSCCNLAKVGCDKPCYINGGYVPLNPPVAAQYLEETEVPAILKAYPDFKPCTLCKGTPDYVPGVWWKECKTPPITEAEATELYDQIVGCGEYGRVETLFFPARGITVSGLKDLLKRRMKEKEGPVDVLVVDYADMVGLDMQGKGAKWEALQYMWEELRALAAEFEILVLTATQGNRSGGEMLTQNSTTAAGTRASIDNSTLVIGLNQSPAERAHGILRFSEIAARKRGFAPEHQAQCISRMDIQDPVYDSWHKWVKTDKRESK